MRKTANYFLTILLIFFLSCNDSYHNFENQKIDKIDVYFIPFDVLPPLGMSVEDIKYSSYKKINNQDKIKKIQKKIATLKQDDSNFMSSNIHLRADFTNNSNEVLRILSDGNTFKIEDQVYELDQDLLNFLLDEDLNKNNN